MTALPEGEHEYSSNEQLIEHPAPNVKSSKINANPQDDVLSQFLEKYDLLDVKEQFLASKLTLDHLNEVERDDLEALCSDLNLSSSQKIRVKFAIKTLQEKKRNRNQIVGASKLSSDHSPTHIEIKESRNGRLKRQIVAKVEQIFGGDAADIAAEEHKVDDKVRRLKSKIVIVGEAAVGKSTLQKAIMGYEFEEGSKATFAVNSVHHKWQYQKDDLCVVVDYEVIDTPGQDRFRDVITLYLRGALAVIVVFDVSKPESFLKAKWWIKYLQSNVAGYDEVILIANKIDIELNADHDVDGNGNEEQEEEEYPGSVFDGVSTAGKSDDCIITDARMYATEHGIAFLEISAKYRDNVDVLMSWIKTQSKSKVQQNPELIEKEQNIKLHEPLLSGNTETGFMAKCC